MSDLINSINNFIVTLCQVLAMIVILIGILKSLVIYIKDALFDKKAFEALKESRLEIGHVGADFRCVGQGLGGLTEAGIFRRMVFRIRAGKRSMGLV